MVVSSPLAPRLFAAPEKSPGREELDRVEQLLAAALREAGERWPKVSLEPEAFLLHLAQKAKAAKEEPSLVLERLALPDLYLACACSQRDPVAIAFLERDCLTPVEGELGRMGMTTVEIDEVKQLLRRRMLTGEPPGRGPSIAQFGGRGPLAAWVKVAAVRAAVDLRRRPGREVSLEERALEAMPSSSSDPELTFLKARYGAEVKAALKEALGALPARELLLLRQHYVDGLTPAEIAALHRVHRTTAGRWLESAQDTLLQKTKELVQQRLQVNRTECESLMRLVRSEMSLTLSAFWVKPGSERSN